MTNATTGKKRMLEEEPNKQSTPVSMDEDLLKIDEISIGSFAVETDVYMIIRDNKNDRQMVVPAELIYRMVEALNLDFAGTSSTHSRYIN